MERFNGVRRFIRLHVEFNRGSGYELTEPQSQAVRLVNLLCDWRRVPWIARGVRGREATEGWNPNKPFFSPPES